MRTTNRVSPAEPKLHRGSAGFHVLKIVFSNANTVFPSNVPDLHSFFDATDF